MSLWSYADSPFVNIIRVVIYIEISDIEDGQIQIFYTGWSKQIYN